jgi:Fe-S oxidoreductase
VGCKGCKRDCPTGVDMARMKIETLHQVKQRRGFTLRDRLVAYLPNYARWAARAAGVMNWRNRSPLLAKLMQALTGISAQRSLPHWESAHFFNHSTVGATAQEVLAAERGVVLFVDTFNGHFESDVALSALRVLQAAGYVVHVASKHAHGHGSNQGHLCCGRTFLATGMVDKAKEKASELLAVLAPFAEKGLPIVGLEPSCLLTLRDEALVLGLGDVAQTVAHQAMMFEEFLAREAKAGKLAVLQKRLDPTHRTILLHGHCHQKAFGVMNPVLETIRLIPGAQPKLIESSCCGMAGSFGYEAQHHDLSMAMAELSLLPAVRAAPDAVIVADGTSCRHQIHDGAQRQAVHVARLLADHLKV